MNPSKVGVGFTSGRLGGEDTRRAIPGLGEMTRLPNLHISGQSQFIDGDESQRGKDLIQVHGAGLSED